MAQILDSLPSDQPDRLVCCYVNATSKIQIARIANVLNWYFERVVFPGQRLVFEAPSESVLEIHTGMMASAILSDKIPCDRLCLLEETHSTGQQDREVRLTVNNHNNIPQPANFKAAILTTID
jgi:hypothetical protein